MAMNNLVPYKEGVTAPDKKLSASQDELCGELVTRYDKMICVEKGESVGKQAVMPF